MALLDEINISEKKGRKEESGGGVRRRKGQRRRGKGRGGEWKGGKAEFPVEEVHPHLLVRCLLAIPD